MPGFKTHTTKLESKKFKESHWGSYFTSEQLFGPTGSLKQLDIAITAASIDASSPCFIQIGISKYHGRKPYNANTKHNASNMKLHLLFPIKYIPILPSQTTPKATRNVQIN